MQLSVLKSLYVAIHPMLAPYKDRFKSLYFQPDDFRNCFNIEGQSHDGHGFILLRLVVDDAAKQIRLKNLFKPKEIETRQLGKALIAAIYAVAAARGYTFLVVEMVPSFRARLLARGAVDRGPDVVEITAQTKLVDTAPKA